MILQDQSTLSHNCITAHQKKLDTQTCESQNSKSQNAQRLTDPLILPADSTQKSFFDSLQDKSSVSDPTFALNHSGAHSYEENAAKCTECNELIPHKLLYICKYKKCYGKFSGKVEYETPMDFYANEKMFCSRCAFTKSHKYHAPFLEESFPIAIKHASTDKYYIQKFRNLAFIDNEDPVDYMISHYYKIPQLPIIDVSGYLLSAESVSEWKAKKKYLDDFKEFVETCRAEGDRVVQDCGKNMIETYENLCKTVEETIKNDGIIIANKKKEERNKRREYTEYKQRIFSSSSDEVNSSNDTQCISTTARKTEESSVKVTRRSDSASKGTAKKCEEPLASNQSGKIYKNKNEGKITILENSHFEDEKKENEKHSRTLEETIDSQFSTGRRSVVQGSEEYDEDGIPDSLLSALAKPWDPLW